MRDSGLESGDRLLVFVREQGRFWLKGKAEDLAMRWAAAGLLFFGLLVVFYLLSAKPTPGSEERAAMAELALAVHRHELNALFFLTFG